jgi:WD40 repeat protein/DNA-binding SARP family transcriptional activator
MALERSLATGGAGVVRGIALAGRIAVQVGDRSIDERALPGRQPRIAFALLVTERHRAVTRDELADNLWPGARPTTWETALRGVVSRVRTFIVVSGLGDRTLLRTDAGTYRLQPLTDTVVDLERAATQLAWAETSLAEGAAQAALDSAAAARGVLTRPLLPGADGPWLDGQRRRLGLLLLRAVETVAAARLALGDHQHAAEAADVAIALDPFRETAHRLLLRAHLGAGDGAAGLRAFERCRRLLAEELGVDPAPETRALHGELVRIGAARVPPGRIGPTAAAAVTARTAVVVGNGRTGPSPDVPPYVGLRTFDRSDAAWFFGRDGDVTRLLDRLDRTRFLAVLGASGSGKSSLVRAGLVPALRRGALPGADTWPVIVVRPGHDPLGGLAAQLAGLAAHLGGSASPVGGARRPDPATLTARLRAGGRHLHELVEGLLRDRRGDGARLLVVVDQLEELFTLPHDPQVARAFLEGLAAAAATPGGRTVVVATLRADVYDRLADHPTVADLASGHQFLVTPMDEVGLAEAVEGPARRAGLRLEPGLTHLILRDVARQPAALPLLQQALLELWHRREDTTLTIAGYHATGGVAEALARRAEAEFDALSPTDQRLARRVLLRLVQPGEGTADSRRVVPTSELVTRPAEQPAVDRVIERLTAARLLTTDRDLVGARRVELAHEALIRAWPRLRAWMDDDRASLVLQRRLTDAAVEWDRVERDDGALFRGAHLAEAQALAARDDIALNPLERLFLAASMRAQETERHGRLRRQRLTVAGLVIGLLVTGALSVLASSQSSRLAAQVRISTARELAAASVANLAVDPERSVLLGLAAVEVTRDADGTPVREAEEALHRAVKNSRVVRRYPGGGPALAVTGDGTRFATIDTAGPDTIVRIREVATGAEVLALRTDPPALAIALDPAGERLATTDGEGRLHLVDARTGTMLGSFEGHDGPAVAVAFDPSGRTLASAGDDATVRIWEAGTSRPLAVLAGQHEGRIDALAFSPDGDRLVSGGHDTTAVAWDLTGGAPAAVLVAHQWQVLDVAVDAAGTRIATASNDGTTRIWDASSGAELRTLYSLAPQHAVAFSPDAVRVATGGSDGTIDVWEVETGRHLLSLPGHTAAIGALAFTSAHDLLSASDDGTTRRWDTGPTGGRDWLTAPAARLRWAGVAFAPDGRSFAVPRDRGGAAIRSTDTGTALRVLGGHAAWLVGLTFSPDGTTLAGSAAHGAAVAHPGAAGATVPIWDVATGELIRTLAGHDDLVSVVAHHPDGTRLLTGTLGGMLREWDATSGDLLGQHELGRDPVLAASDDGDGWVAVTAPETDAPVATPITVWDVPGGRRFQLLGSTGMVTVAAIAADDLLATGGRDGVARVWDLRSGALLATLRGHGAPLGQLSFDRDGARLATAGEDGTVRVWEAATGRELLTLWGHDLIAYGVAFSADGRLLATSSPDGTVALHLLPIDEFLEVARSRVTRGLTEEECRQYLRGARCSTTVTAAP